MKTKHEHKVGKATRKRRRASGSAVTPTLFEQLEPILHALNEEMDGKSDAGAPRPKLQLPSWCRNIVRRLGQTILRPVIKLRPNGQVNWRHYGRAIGIVERARAFWEHDVPRILVTEFADVTAAQWKKIEKRLGLDQVRAQCGKMLNRPVAADEPLDNLLEEAWERQKAQFDQVRQTAFMHVAQQPPKVARQFYKGLAEGFTVFLDEAAGFSGDRGRTEIYLNLLACMLEVEQLRRTLPPTTRRRYYDRLSQTFKLPPSMHDWFNDVCDDIKFPLNNLGRPRRSPYSAG